MRSTGGGKGGKGGLSHGLLQLWGVRLGDWIWMGGWRQEDLMLAYLLL